MIEVERVGEQRDCKHCSRTYGTLGCCSTVSNKWVYSCEEGHREYEETHKHMTIPEAIEVLAQDLPCETDEDLVEAMAMAIKALDQQPCEDAVNRQSVHSLMATLLSDYLHDEDREKIELIDAEIAELPSVTPKEKTGWIPVTYRLMTEEEKKYYEEYTDCDLTEIFDCPMPEDGQEILISISGGYVCADVCSIDDKYGVGLESHDSWEDVIAWMPLPKPYEPQERG